jgi:hypothetical protein
MKDVGQLVYRNCMSRVLRKATMFCRSTHLKDRQVLTNGDTISSTLRMCTKGFRLTSEVKASLVIDYNSYVNAAVPNKGFYTNELNQTVSPLKTENHQNY